MRRRPLIAGAAAFALSGLCVVPAAEGVELSAWKELVEETRTLARELQLEAANRSIDLRLRYLRDADDEWQSPLTSLRRRTGDCEDFAIAKYALLRSCGWTDSDVVLAYGTSYAFTAPQRHLVAVEVSQGQLLRVLDNLGDKALLLEDRHDLQLLFAFGESRVWACPQGRLQATSHRLTRFESLAAEMRAEGSLPPPARALSRSEKPLR